MADETTNGLLRELASIAESGIGSPVNWDERPDGEASGSDPAGRVQVGLRGFNVTGVAIDAEWIRTAPVEEVQDTLKQAIDAALGGLIDAEIELARRTPYEQADVHQKLLRLSDEASGVLNSRIRDLGQSVR